MSTEHQQYSTENQALCIAQDAQSHGFTITHTYCESAKSGFGLKGRPGLRELLRDVTEGGTAYKAILGYDVRRSGRFQDTDEAAPMNLCANQPVFRFTIARRRLPRTAACQVR